VRCEDLAEVLVSTPAGIEISDPLAERHISSCLRCQAEMVQYRRLTRSLRALRADVMEPGPSLVADILASLEAAGDRHALRGMLQGRAAAYVGGFAVATAAGAGALVLASRGGRRRVRIAG
jgi:anti-sigma factor RsiW